MRADAISSTADWMASGGGEERAFVECARAGLVRRVVYFRSLARNAKGTLADTDLSDDTLPQVARRVLEELRQSSKGSKSRFKKGLLDLARQAATTPPVAQGSLMRLAADGFIADLAGEGTLADISVRGGELSDSDTARLAESLGNPGRMAEAHMAHVEAYLLNGACRRNRLLQYFGASSDAKHQNCCDICEARREARRGALHASGTLGRVWAWLRGSNEAL